MNISGKDMNLLILFKVLFQERNLTKAAKKMHLSQPALSHKLNKLRHEFSDPLFVRTSRGVTPTPKAELIADQVIKIVEETALFYAKLANEDFLQAHEKVCLYTTDYIESLLMPALLKRITKYAPNLQISVVNTKGILPLTEMENGECDIAIAGFYQDCPANLYRQNLRQDDFAVLASKSNNLIKGKLTLEQYLTCKHILTTLTGDLTSVIDTVLAQNNQQRHIIAGLSSFLSPPSVVQYSDLLLTCLTPIADSAVAESDDLISYPLPLHIPPIDIQQFWHERTHHNPLRQWLRTHIKQIMTSS